MDLLDRFGQNAGDAKGSRAQSGLGTHRRNAQTMLLDRVHPPHRQKNQQISAMGFGEESKIEVNGNVRKIYLLESTLCRLELSNVA
jgi:hypothetical protein